MAAERQLRSDRFRAWFEGSRRDLRFALRTFVRQPGFTLTAVLTLALGIGATAAIWSVVQAVLLSGLPYPQADRIVLVQGMLRETPGLEEPVPISYRDYYDWDQTNRVFAAFQVYSEALSYNLLVGDQPEHVLGELVSGGYFDLLGAKASQGRALTPDDDLAGASPVVVVSHGLEQRHAPEAGSIVGTTLRLNGRPYEVIGVMAPDFQGLTDRAELWLPMSETPGLLSPGHLIRRGLRWLNGVGRLAPGVSLRQAREEMDRLAAHLEEEYKGTNEDIGVGLVPLAEAWFGKLRLGLLLLLGGAASVLLLACANVAGLLLARAATRQREISIRTVLGHRPALVRQLLLESLLLACVACAVGLVLADWAVRLLGTASAIDLRSFVRLGVDVPVIAGILGVSVVCALGFGIVPAWLSSRPDLRGSLQDGGRGSGGKGRHRFLAGIVVSEVALSIVVLVGAGLLVQAFQEIRRADLGFRADGVLAVRIALKGERYAGLPAVRSLARELADRLPRLPGAESAALVSPDIPSDDWNAFAFLIDDRRDAPAEEESYLIVHSVTPGYFRTLGIPLVRGRDFTAADDERTPTGAILGRAAAERFWPGQEPIGKRLRIADVGTPWLTVVGVAGDVRHGGPYDDSRPGPDVYFALLQSPPHGLSSLNLLLRADPGARESLVAALRRELKTLAPDLPLHDVASLEERLARQVAHDRFLATVLSLFAALALALVTVGIYGVVSYTVAQRRSEIGIRMALGARRRDVFRQMLRRGTRLAGAGIALGVLAALALTPVLSRFLHGVGATDPLTLFGACLVLTVAVLAANCVPSWRASRTEPAKTLRAD